MVCLFISLQVDPEPVNVEGSSLLATVCNFLFKVNGTMAVGNIGKQAQLLRDVMRTGSARQSLDHDSY